MSLTVGLVFSRRVRELGNSLLCIIQQFGTLSNELYARLERGEGVLKCEVPTVQSPDVCLKFREGFFKASLVFI